MVLFKNSRGKRCNLQTPKASADESNESNESRDCDHILWWFDMLSPSFGTNTTGVTTGHFQVKVGRLLSPINLATLSLGRSSWSFGLVTASTCGFLVAPNVYSISIQWGKTELPSLQATWDAIALDSRDVHEMAMAQKSGKKMKRNYFLSFSLTDWSLLNPKVAHKMLLPCLDVCVLEMEPGNLCWRNKRCHEISKCGKCGECDKTVEQSGSWRAPGLWSEVVASPKSYGSLAHCDMWN